MTILRYLFGHGWLWWSGFTLGMAAISVATGQHIGVVVTLFFVSMLMHGLAGHRSDERRDERQHDNELAAFTLECLADHIDKNAGHVLSRHYIVAYLRASAHRVRAGKTVAGGEGDE